MSSHKYEGAPRWEGSLAADVTPNLGDLACVNSDGWYVPGSVAEGLKCIGAFFCRGNSTGKAAGTVPTEVEVGHAGRRFRMTNAAAPNNLTKVGESAYIDGPRAVTALSTGRSKAGMVAGFEPSATDAKAVVLVYINPLA